ncbi:hypothetical protein Pelo_18003 [Pelomyxa schiedti]|nr:hypothetical protein Pelo_18003 [Pelomyxa schiedti]
MCYLCHISSSHATHKCVPLDDIGSQIRESILGSVSKLEETVALESEAIKGCEASILDAMKSLLSISSTAQSEMDSICQSMKHKTSDLVSTCNLLSSLIEAKVKEHKECLEVCMSTHQRTITRAHEIAKSSDVVSLIAADKKLKETLCECTQLVSSGAMTPCFSAKNIVHHINTQALKEVLDDDDFASVQYHNSITTDPQAAPQFSIKALKGRVVQLEESLAKESVLNSELRAQLEEKQQQITHLSDLAAHIPTKLEAKVAMSCGPYVSTPNNPETYFPENSLMDDATVFASPLVPFSGEVFIVYQVLSPKRVTAFQLKNRASSTQIVKTFSLLGSDTETGPWTGILNHAAADVSGAVAEYRIADCLQHFRFWKLLLLENNGSNAGCGFVLQYVAFIGLQGLMSKPKIMYFVEGHNYPAVSTYKEKGKPPKNVRTKIIYHLCYPAVQYPAAKSAVKLLASVEREESPTEGKERKRDGFPICHSLRWIDWVCCVPFGIISLLTVTQGQPLSGFGSSTGLPTHPTQVFMYSHREEYLQGFVVTIYQSNAIGSHPASVLLKVSYIVPSYLSWLCRTISVVKTVSSLNRIMSPSCCSALCISSVVFVASIYRILFELYETCVFCLYVYCPMIADHLLQCHYSICLAAHLRSFQPEVITTVVAMPLSANPKFPNVSAAYYTELCFSAGLYYDVPNDSGVESKASTSAILLACC